MITLFKYSTKKYPPVFSLAWAVGVQVVGAVFVAVTFQLVGIYLGKVMPPTQVLAACSFGVPAGFLLVALSSRPPGQRRVAFVSTFALGFAIFYWLVSESVPDLWLSHVMASFGTGVALAAIYRLLFLNAPVMPRVK